jgi:histidinol-phosphate/aromatic aminotransferase/cobyric acid decarboxylase-like protein
MSKITPQPGIMEIAPYQGGAAHVEGVANAVKLSSNENPFGPSEAAREAFRRAAFTARCAPPLATFTGSTRRASSAARAATRSSPFSARPMPGRDRR